RREFVHHRLDCDTEFAAVAVGLATPVPTRRQAGPPDGHPALAVTERSPTGIGNYYWDAERIRKAFGGPTRAFRQAQQVVVGHVRAIDPGVDTDVTESRFGQEKGRFHEEVGALFEDRLGESGVLFVATSLAESGCDLRRARSRREIREVVRTAFGLRDDRACDTHDISRAKIRAFGDHLGEVVAGTYFGNIGHCGDVHGSIPTGPHFRTSGRC